MGIPGAANPLLLASAAAGGYQIERSLRFNSADSAYLSRTPASAGNRKTWTWSGWVKNTSSSATNYPATLLFARNGAFIGLREYFWLAINNAFTSNGHQLAAGDGSVNYLVSTAFFRDPSAWYHIVCSYDSTQATADNRLRLYVNGAEITAFNTNNRASISQNSDGVINRSAIEHRAGLHVSIYSDCYLANIHFIDGQALTPSSFGETDGNGVWQPKAYTGSYGTNGFHLPFSDNSTAAALGTDTSGNGNTWTVNNLSVTSGYQPVTGVGTNPGNMFDINVNSFAAGAANSTMSWTGSINLGPGKYYVILSAWGQESQGPSSATLTVGGVSSTTTWSQLRDNTDILNVVIGSGGTFTETADGRRSNLTPTTSGALTQISLGAVGGGFTNRIYAVVFIPTGVGDTNFANHVVVNNVLPSNNDSLVDTPTSYGTDTGVGGEVRGNYATLNPLDIASGVTLSNGNLEVAMNASFSTISATIYASSGKWYAEMAAGTQSQAGIVRAGAFDRATRFGFGLNQSGGYAYNYFDGLKFNNGTSSAYGATYGAGDVIGVAMDLDTGTLTFYKNGVSQGAAFSSLPAGNYTFGTGHNNSSGTIWNFGQRPFAYTAPSGFKALCTQNLPEGTITTSGSFTGNANADGPFVYLNGVPTAMTINGNSPTFGTHVDKLSNGFKLRTLNVAYNFSGSNTYSVTTTGSKFKYARAQPNP